MKLETTNSDKRTGCNWRARRRQSQGADRAHTPLKPRAHASRTHTNINPLITPDMFLHTDLQSNDMTRNICDYLLHQHQLRFVIISYQIDIEQV